ncbi:Uncharacterised protein [Neisseria meningitidis]|nr:Uncharacterised protein [Neisseria meningitidis]
MSQYDHHGKTEQCQQRGRLMNIAQADQGCRIGNDNACAFQGNQCQKQTDTGSNRHFQTHRQCVDQHFPDFKKAEQDENQTGDEHRTQRNLPRHAHTLNDGKGEIGIQPHPRCECNRIVADKTHNKTADGRRDTGSDEYRPHIHAGLAQNQRVDDNDVAHRQKSCQTRHQLGTHRRTVCLQLKNPVQQCLF